MLRLHELNGATWTAMTGEGWGRSELSAPVLDPSPHPHPRHKCIEFRWVSLRLVFARICVT